MLHLSVRSVTLFKFKVACLLWGASALPLSERTGKMVAGNDSALHLPLAFAAASGTCEPIPRGGGRSIDDRLYRNQRLPEPRAFEKEAFVGSLHCAEKALWRFSRVVWDFGYDAELLRQDQVDAKALLGQRAVVSTSHARSNGVSIKVSILALRLGSGRLLL